MSQSRTGPVATAPAVPGLIVPTVVDRPEVRRLIEEDHAQLVEVLPQDEYDEEHLPGALHLPLKQLDAAAAARTLDAGRPVVVYCWDGL